MSRARQKSIPLYIDVDLDELRKLKQGYPGAAEEIANFLTSNGMPTHAPTWKNFHGTWKATAQALYEEAAQLFGSVQIYNPDFPFSKKKPGRKLGFTLDWYFQVSSCVEKIKNDAKKEGADIKDCDAIRRILSWAGLKDEEKLFEIETQWIKHYATHQAMHKRMVKIFEKEGPCPVTAALSQPLSSSTDHVDIEDNCKTHPLIGQYLTTEFLLRNSGMTG